MFSILQTAVQTERCGAYGMMQAAPSASHIHRCASTMEPNVCLSEDVRDLSREVWQKMVC